MGSVEPSHIASLLEAVPLPAVLIGRAERILGANSRALSLLGTGLVGRHFIAAVRQPTVLENIEACLRDGTPHQSRFLSTQSGLETSFVASCSPLSADLGGGVLVCFEDVTHLEQVGQMRRDFVANVSHELRSPLTALLGFIETLRGPARNDAAASERFLGIMQAEASRMERLVKDLLSLSRVEAQERVRPTDRVDLSGLIDSVLYTLRPVADTQGVQFRLDKPAEKIEVPGDGDQLRQVLTNLIENAVKYGGRDRTVFITLDRAGNDPSVRGPAVSVAVRDQGPGIDAIHIPRLTERFYRIDSHRSREMGGTGLGLAIVKHIVSRHRGRLRVTSQPGQGSEFRIILPQEHP